MSGGNCSGVTILSSPAIPCCIIEIPIKIKPKPAHEKTIVAQRFFEKSFKKAPIKITGKMIASSFNLKLRRRTNHPVTVVPILAPKIIPNDSGQLINLAPIKPTEATVVALDCSLFTEKIFYIYSRIKARDVPDKHKKIKPSSYKYVINNTTNQYKSACNYHHFFRSCKSTKSDNKKSNTHITQGLKPLSNPIANVNRGNPKRLMIIFPRTSD